MTPSHTEAARRARAFTKIVCPGTGRGLIFCKIVYVDLPPEHRPRLSITGVDGPLRGGDALGACGQIVDAVRKCATTWDHDVLLRFCDVWDAWHLNDMRAGCVHQRAMGWMMCPGHADHDQQCAEPLMWPVTRPPSPGSAMIRCQYDAIMAKCPVCGYAYGSAWLYEPVPDAVLDFLESLPDAPTRPAWI